MKATLKFLRGVLLTIILLCILVGINHKEALASRIDNKAPTIGSIRVLTSYVYTPGTFQLELNDIVEEGIGISDIFITMKGYDANGKYVGTAGAVRLGTPNTELFSTKKLVISDYVPDFNNTGTYYIEEVVINDWQSNSTVYKASKPNSNSYTLKSEDGKECKINGILKVYSEDYDITTSIANPNVGTIISNMEDGQVADLIVMGSNTTVPKSAFDAIKGTNKKINVSVSDGIRWIFNGKDITGSTKAVNCKVDISTVQDAAYGTTDKLMKTTFASNGQLPGKATVKLKSDYLAKLYKLDQKLYLYYLDGQKLTMEDSDVKTLKDGNNNWCEYELDHNSTFLLSQKKLSYKKPYVKFNTSLLTLQVKQSSSALKISGKLSSDKVKKWSSSKSSVVFVNSKSGKLKAKKPGTAYITVQLNSGVKAKCKVKVQKSAVKTKSITVGKSKVILRKGKTYTIPVKRKPITANDGKMTFKSSKPKIVSVSSKGKIKAVRKGKARITVKAGKKAKKITVVVK